MILDITLDDKKLKQCYPLILIVQFPYTGSESTAEDIEDSEDS
jgi:hypothetical protein